MKKALSLWIFAFLILGAFAPAAMAASLVRFDGGIGVIPVSSAAGTQNADGTFPNVNRNDVHGVAPGGQPWVISKLDALVDDNGNIKVHGKGLLLAGGNAIGTPGGQSVVATLICGADLHSTPAENAVKLADNGDFKINDVLDNLPLPDPCENPVLLIRNVVKNPTTNQLEPGRWFAAGIPAN